MEATTVQKVRHNTLDALADLGIDISKLDQGWTATRVRSDSRGPFEEWIGAWYPTYDEAVAAALTWKK